MKAILLLPVVALCASCGQGKEKKILDNKETIIENSLLRVESLREFVKLFPESKHFVSYITQEPPRPHWNSKAAIFGRYVIHLHAPVIVDANNLVVELTEEPSIEIREVTLITPIGGGRSSISYGEILKVSQDQWRALVVSNGDWRNSNIVLVKDKPVDGFRDYLIY